MTVNTDSAGNAINPPLAVGPHDPGFTSASATFSGATGAYIDLGFNNSPGSGSPVFNYSATPSLSHWRSVAGPSIFLGPLIPANSKPTNLYPSYTYDTWSLHYENNGIAENSNHAADTGMNGLDDAVNGFVDGVGSSEHTQAPFAAQLRGLKITVRCYEPGSQQVREFTVVQDFFAD